MLDRFGSTSKPLIPKLKKIKSIKKVHHWALRILREGVNPRVDKVVLYWSNTVKIEYNINNNNKLIRFGYTYCGSLFDDNVTLLILASSASAERTTALSLVEREDLQVIIIVSCFSLTPSSLYRIIYKKTHFY